MIGLNNLKTNKIMEYKVIIENNLKVLELEVNKLISKGYIPIGGICMNKTETYLQAMIKNK